MKTLDIVINLYVMKKRKKEKHRLLNRSEMVCLQHNTYELFEELESSIGTISYG